MAIANFTRLTIIAPSTSRAKNILSNLQCENIDYYNIPTNDTWTRDYGPISVIEDKRTIYLDFQFNGWGLKFGADKDNLVNTHLHKLGYIQNRENHLGYTLEGGALETDGRGVLLTTTKCLLSPNRNGDLSQQEIVNFLSKTLGVRKIIWLNDGYLAGDDTDSHIDTLARFTPSGSILYVAIDDVTDEHYKSLKAMELQLAAATDIDGKNYRLVKLPLPDAIYDNEGFRLPATYANYLVVNGHVIVPIYNQPQNDAKALDIISKEFPCYQIDAVDCTPLIKQHGSLHCSTMQIVK